MNIAPPGPTIVSRVPGRFPFGGGRSLALVDGALSQVAEWDSPDGQSRRGQILVTGRVTASIASIYGLAVKVTTSGPRGQMVAWYAAPNLIPFSGTRVVVEMGVTTAPAIFGVNFSTLSIRSSSIPGDFRPLTGASGFALIMDDWADQPPPAVICAGKKAGGMLAIGPVFVTAVSIANTSSSAIQVLITDLADPQTDALNFSPVHTTIVPGGSVLGIGADLLGPFFNGLCVEAVLDITNSPPFRDIGAHYGGFDGVGASGLSVCASGILMPMAGG